jgi:hypothetical protein
MTIESRIPPLDTIAFDAALLMVCRDATPGVAVSS